MKVPCFIIGSAIMISLWLTATYLRAVPMETYGAPGAAAVVTPELPGSLSSAEASHEAH